MQTKEEAIAQVGAHANKEWHEEALLIVFELASYQNQFTTDDVWSRIPEYAHTHEGRAMGAIMKIAQKNGWITATDRFISSSSRVNHGRPLRLWKSNLMLKKDQPVPQIHTLKTTTTHTCAYCKGLGYFSHNVEGDCLDFVTCATCKGAGVHVW